MSKCLTGWHVFNSLFSTAINVRRYEWGLYFANEFYNQTESFRSQAIFSRQRTVIQLREMYFHYLFITIVTACFLPVGWIDYICYGAHFLYRIGKAAEPCRSPSKIRARFVDYAGGYRPTVPICRQKCWTFLSISFCTCMLPLTLCFWPQSPTMRFVSRREPLALSNIRTIIIKERETIVMYVFRRLRIACLLRREAAWKIERVQAFATVRSQFVLGIGVSL